MGQLWEDGACGPRGHQQPMDPGWRGQAVAAWPCAGACLLAVREQPSSCCLGAGVGEEGDCMAGGSCVFCVMGLQSPAVCAPPPASLKGLHGTTL